jgi:hypothetical protein
MGLVGGVFGTKSVSSLPSLCGKNLVTEALGVVCPGRVLGVIGDFGAAIGLSVVVK